MARLDQLFKDTLAILKSTGSPVQAAAYLSNILITFIKEYANWSTPEAILFYYFEIFFSPKLIMRHLAVIAALQSGVLISGTFHKLYCSICQRFSKKGMEMKRLYQKLSQSKAYLEWKEHASNLDRLDDMEKWKREDKSSFYDHRAIRTRINDSKEMMQRGDIFNLIFRIRGGLSRDQFGIQHEGLFTRTMIGTKWLVEEYHETVKNALNFICDSPIADEEIPIDAKLAFFNETRHAYGRTALMLSGGAYLGYYHMGVIRALYSENLLPRVVSGSSAGSLGAAMLGTHTDEELKEILSDDATPKAICKMKRVFFKHSEELKSPTGRILQHYTPRYLRWMMNPVLAFVFDKKLINLDTEHFKKEVMEMVGMMTFQEAFDKSGRIVNLTVAPLNNYDPPRLLNYLTAPHVCVWSAAAASCALPGIFDSFTLMVKEPNGNYSPENIWTRQVHSENEVLPQKFSDGSLESDLPMKQISELFNCNHFIISQVNPHSALLSTFTLQGSVWANPLYGAIVSYIKFLRAQCKDWLKNVVQLLISRSLAPAWSTKRGIFQALTQDYEGRAEDITIFPWVKSISVPLAFMSIIKNPTDKEFMEVVGQGEQSTWRYMSRIKANCMVEITLDQCVQRLRRLISEENDAAAQQRAQELSQWSHQIAAPKGKFDRTPSFYTTRQIVHLSGLSVSDPVPLSLQASHMYNLKPSTSHSIATVHGGGWDDFDHRSSSSAFDSIDLVVQGPDVPLHGSVQIDQPPSPSLSRLQRGDSLISAAAAAVVDGSNGSKEQLGGAVEGNRRHSITSSISNNSVEDRESQNQPKSGIKKTTSMAKFYYRQSGNGHSSGDSLSNLQ